MIQMAGAIFGTVLVPILLLVGMGALVQRFHPMPLREMAKWVVYLFVPAFLFDRVVGSKLSWAEMAQVAGTVLLVKAILAGVLFAVLGLLRVPKKTVSVILLASVVFNAGNFGIPVAERAFGAAGGAVEALVVMISNLSLWGIGYALSSAISGGGMAGLVAYFRLPMVYVLTLALGMRATRLRFPEPMAYSIHMIAESLVPLSLLILGAQLATKARWPNWKIVGPVMALKLIAMPLVAGMLVWMLGSWPWPGAQLIVAAAGPTAVNTVLLAMEQDADVELAADCVFWTTIGATFTVTIVLTLVQTLGANPPSF